jgi:hypothetical protein
MCIVQHVGQTARRLDKVLFDGVLADAKPLCDFPP